MPSKSTVLRVCAALALVAMAGGLRAEPMKVRHPQGSAHGFVEVTTLDGTRIGVGDLVQSLRGTTVTSRLTLNFFDGSLDDETTLFSQKDVFRFISDHHVQHGPSFPKPVDTTVDASRSLVSSTDSDGNVVQAHLDMPPDVYNGLASSMIMNMLPSTSETTISIVIAAAKPRIVHLSMRNAGEVTFTIAGLSRKALDYVAHVELGGVAGVVAPIVGKEPADYHVWISAGDVPAFIREEGQLYEGGPIWRIQQISAAFAK